MPHGEQASPLFEFLMPADEANSVGEYRKRHGKHAACQNDPAHGFAFHFRSSFIDRLAVCELYPSSSTIYPKLTYAHQDCQITDR
jgi:hypothetical protein